MRVDPKKFEELVERVERTAENCCSRDELGPYGCGVTSRHARDLVRELEARVAQLEKENERIYRNADAGIAGDERDRALERIEELSAALREAWDYTTHTVHCCGNPTKPEECDCGFIETDKRIGKALREPDKRLEEK